MTDQGNAAPEAETTGDVTPVTVAGIKTKEELYDRLQQAALSFTRATKDGRVVMAKSRGHDLADLALEGIFEIVFNEGRIALPGGRGAIGLRALAPRQIRTPQGAIVNAPARWGIKIEPGTALKARLDGLQPPAITEAVSE